MALTCRPWLAAFDLLCPHRRKDALSSTLSLLSCMPYTFSRSVFIFWMVESEFDDFQELYARPWLPSQDLIHNCIPFSSFLSLCGKIIYPFSPDFNYKLWLLFWLIDSQRLDLERKNQTINFISPQLSSFVPLNLSLRKRRSTRTHRLHKPGHPSSYHAHPLLSQQKHWPLLLLLQLLALPLTKRSSSIESSSPPFNQY